MQLSRSLSLDAAQMFHSNRWLVESSLPATSETVELRKSSYPSPPEITRSFEWVPRWSGLPLAEFFCIIGSEEAISMKVRNRTWPVCPCGIPTTEGIVVNFVEVAVICGRGIVSSTPAEVPIQRRSLQAKSEVTRRHAALCCRIISSQPNYENNKQQHFTTIPYTYKLASL